MRARASAWAGQWGRSGGLISGVRFTIEPGGYQRGASPNSTAAATPASTPADARRHRHRLILRRRHMQILERAIPEIVLAPQQLDGASARRAPGLVCAEHLTARAGE
jgi:hypothetical protein